MTSEQWEEATEVDFVAAKPTEPHDTEPAPAPTEPPPAPAYVPHYVGPCSFCNGHAGFHDPACPLNKAIAP